MLEICRLRWKYRLEDVSQNFNGSPQGPLWIFLLPQDWRDQTSHGAPSFENDHSFPRPLDLVQDRQTLRLELGSPDLAHVITFK